MNTEVLLARQDNVATITLNREDKGNALTLEMLAQIDTIARDFIDDEETRAVIVQARGGNFSFGMDITAMGGETAQQSVLMQRRKADLGSRMMRSLQEIPQPTICAIQGIATGGATCIASACDFRIASDSARMGYGEVKLGMNLMWNGLSPCVRLIGPSRAKQMIMSGKLFPADTLERWGFIDEVCNEDALAERAQAWANEYAALPPVAVQMIKRSVNRVAGAMDEAIMHADADQWLLATRTADFSEAVTAFMEKRDPSFTGN